MEPQSSRDYQLPACYHIPKTVFKPSHVSIIALETLFYIFYSMPFDRWQSMAAQELMRKSWSYWEEKNIWVLPSKAADEELKKKVEVQVAEWICFDPVNWRYAPIESVNVSGLRNEVAKDGEGK